VILQSDTEAWKAARVGRVTASRICDMLAKTKTGWSTSRTNYAAELIVERLTGGCGESGYVNAAMQWGIDTEPHAIAAYEFREGVTVAPAAFVIHPGVEWAGASTDGFVGDDGLVEVKCPLTSTHIENLLSQRVPPKYVTQMQWEMACTGRRWTDFISFDPRLPERLRFFSQRVERDDAVIAQLEKDVEIFNAEIEDTIKQLERHGD